MHSLQKYRKAYTNLSAQEVNTRNWHTNIYSSLKKYLVKAPSPITSHNWKMNSSASSRVPLSYVACYEPIAIKQQNMKERT
jgi:hypothetical protein